MKPVKIVSNKSANVLEIGWDPSNYCNFKCEYCFPGSNAGTHKFSDDLDLVVGNFKHLINFYKENLGKDKVHLSMAGGEPTLWKHLAEFIAKIKQDNNVYFSLISNGSRTLRWWEENAYLIDNAHLTHHVAEGNVTHIIAVADALHERGTKTTVKVLMDPKHWDKAINDIAIMKTHSRNRWFIMTAEVIDNTADPSIPRYSPEQLKYLKRDLKRLPNLLWFWRNRHLIKDELRFFDSTAMLEDGTTMRASPGAYFNRGWNSFKDWDCSIGLDRIYMNWTGNITGACNAKLFGLDTYFNITSPNFTLEFNPPLTSTKCPNTACWCMPETHLTKVNLSKGNVSGARTVIPITDYRLYINTKSP